MERFGLLTTLQTLIRRTNGTVHSFAPQTCGKESAGKSCSDPGGLLLSLLQMTKASRFTVSFSIIALGAVILLTLLKTTPKEDLGESKPEPPPGYNAPTVVALNEPTPPSVVTISEKAAKLNKVLSEENHQPVAFYGRVLDQFENPVTEADVIGELQYNTGTMAGMTKLTAKTNEKGGFEFTGSFGKSLSLRITKTGYQFTPEGGGYEYSKLVPPPKRHNPDPAKPVILRMWKLQKAEPVRYGLKSLEIVPDGNETRLDIHTGKIVKSGGDLIVTLKYEPQPKNSIPKVPYDWSASVTIVNGGLVTSEQRIENMMQAPEVGYKSTFVLDVLASNPQWYKALTKNFYVKFRGTEYAKLQMSFACIPREPAGSIQAIWWLNPSGSRNLEYDEKLQGELK